MKYLVLWLSSAFAVNSLLTEDANLEQTDDNTNHKSETGIVGQTLPILYKFAEMNIPAIEKLDKKSCAGATGLDGLTKGVFARGIISNSCTCPEGSLRLKSRILDNRRYKMDRNYGQTTQCYKSIDKKCPLNWIDDTRDAKGDFCIACDSKLIANLDTGRCECPKDHIVLRGHDNNVIGCTDFKHSERNPFLLGTFDVDKFGNEVSLCGKGTGPYQSEYEGRSCSRCPKGTVSTLVPFKFYNQNTERDESLDHYRCN